VTAFGLLVVSVANAHELPDLGPADRALREIGEARVEHASPAAGVVVPLSKGLRTRSGPFVAPDQGTATEIVPPGAVVWTTSDCWHATTDAVGIQHVYWRQGRGWGAISTSAVALGLLGGSGPDDDALAVAALAGHPLESATVVSDVRLLRAGEVCELRDGRVHLSRVASRPTVGADGWIDDLATIRRTGAEVVRSIVDDALRTTSPPVLELSGGLDSRVVLAAIPPERRQGLEAFTLGHPGSADQLVACEIARRNGLDHRCIDMTQLADIPSEEAEALVVTAGWEADWSGNAVALAVLKWAESRVADDRPRLSGQNGEFGRGFYYALLPRWTPNVDASVRALGRWRAFANDRVDDELLRSEVRARAEDEALATLRRLIPPGPFLASTDELYLDMRMARWLGPTYTVASRSRIVLAPFLDDRYLSWVRSVSPTRRRGSRALAAVLHELDAGLASVPLAGGPAPRVLAEGGLRATRATAPAFGRKLVAKARQRVRPVSRPPVGATALAGLVQRAWAQRPHSLEAAAASPLVRPEIVSEIARGTRPASAATVGFLLALDELERMGARREREGSRLIA
jgi:asparagine synthase (glutamine-hydrolysing)